MMACTRLVLQVSKSMLGTKVFQEGCVDQVTGLLLEHLAVVSTHIAFPEYAVPTVVQVWHPPGLRKTDQVKCFRAARKRHGLSCTYWGPKEQPR
jgi:hypothetical protein